MLDNAHNDKASEFAGPLGSRYEVYGEIASGGMACVQYGRLLGARGFSRTVAIKRLHAHFSQEPEFVSMFLDEARLSALLLHANIIHTLDVIEAPGEVALVMEYVHGESLWTLLRLARAQSAHVPVRIGCALIASVLHGLHAAHEARTQSGEPLYIVHRDVSPQNILVGSDGIPRVLDFGIAKAMGRLRSTPRGEIKGKLGYVACEQLRAQPVDRRTDVYGAAVVLWEVLTGVPLFAAPSESAIVHRVLYDEIEAPSALRAELPKQLDAIVLRALSRDMMLRHDTAAEMALELEREVGLATQSEVASWLHAVAGRQLTEKSQRLAALRQAASGEGFAGTRRLPARVAAAPAPAPAPVVANAHTGTTVVVPLLEPPPPPAAKSTVANAHAATTAVVPLLEPPPSPLPAGKVAAANAHTGTTAVVPLLEPSPLPAGKVAAANAHTGTTVVVPLLEPSPPPAAKSAAASLTTTVVAPVLLSIEAATAAPQPGAADARALRERESVPVQPGAWRRLAMTALRVVAISGLIGLGGWLAARGLELPPEAQRWPLSAAQAAPVEVSLPPAVAAPESVVAAPVQSLAAPAQPFAAPALTAPAKPLTAPVQSLAAPAQPFAAPALAAPAKPLTAPVPPLAAPAKPLAAPALAAPAKPLTAPVQSLAAPAQPLAAPALAAPAQRLATSEPVAPELPAPSPAPPAAADSEKPAHPKRALRPAHVGARPSRPREPCALYYEIDARGIRRPKPECL